MLRLVYGYCLGADLYAVPANEYGYIALADVDRDASESNPESQGLGRFEPLFVRKHLT